MPTPDTSGVPPFADFEMLKGKINEIVQKYNNLLVNLDSLNVVSITANSTTITSNLDGGAYIRLDGNGIVVNDGSENTFEVDINGKVTMTGATIQSTTGYPKVVMDPTNNLFAAYKDANNYVQINADYNGSPVINVIQSGTVRGQIAALSNNMLLSATTNLQLQANNDVQLTPGPSNYVRVGSFGKIFGTSEGMDLATKLGQKVDTTTAFHSYAVNMTFDNTSRNLKLFAGDGTQLAVVNIPV